MTYITKALEATALSYRLSSPRLFSNNIHLHPFSRSCSTRPINAGFWVSALCLALRPKTAPPKTTVLKVDTGSSHVPARAIHETATSILSNNRYVCPSHQSNVTAIHCDEARRVAGLWRRLAACRSTRRGVRLRHCRKMRNAHDVARSRMFLMAFNSTLTSLQSTSIPQSRQK